MPELVNSSDELSNFDYGVSSPRNISNINITKNRNITQIREAFIIFSYIFFLPKRTKKRKKMAQGSQV